MGRIKWEEEVGKRENEKDGDEKDGRWFRVGFIGNTIHSKGRFRSYKKR